MPTKTPLLKTKLYKPLVKDHYVIREKVIQSLENNIDNPLSLVVAGAGYGKSVAVSEWLNHSKSNYCWISLDDEFNTTHTFLSYLVFAIKSIYPEKLAELQNLLHNSETPPQNVSVRILINELSELDNDLIVVLDDYHLINNGQIHDIVNTLIKYLPSKVHLVIVSRHEPPLKLSRIRSYGNITELGIAALSFNINEIKILANKLIQIQITDEQAGDILKKTEGWVVTVRLVLQQIAKNNDIDKSISDIRLTDDNLDQYLLEEVLGSFAKPIQKLLMIASLPERFNRDLVDAIVNMRDEIACYPDNEAFKTIIDDGNFVINLDEQNHWFRFHHLFRNFLLRQLEHNFSKEQICDYHKRASFYFRDASLFEECLLHAKKAGDLQLMVQIIEQNRLKLMGTEHFVRLWKWLNMFPKSELEKHPKLLLSQSFRHNVNLNYSEMRITLDAIEKILESRTIDSNQNSGFMGEYFALKACLAYKQGDFENSLQFSRKSLKLLPVQTPYIEDFARAYLAFSLNAKGQGKEALMSLKRSLNRLSVFQKHSRIIQLVTLSILYTTHGELHETVKVAKRYSPMCKENELWVSYVYGIYYQGAVNYQWNNLNAAVSLLSAAEKFRYSGRVIWIMNSMFTKLLALQAQGRAHELELALQLMREFTKDFPIESIQQLAKAFEVELKLQQNNIDEAEALGENLDFEAIQQNFFLYHPKLTLVKLLLNSKQSQSIKLAEADKLLKNITAQGRSQNDINILIHALPLQALLHNKRGNSQAAIENLQEALNLSRPGGFIRVYLDLGAPMQKMICELTQQIADDFYLTQINNAFKKEQNNLYKINQVKKSPVHVNNLDLLKNREIELLQLVADGYRNKEIAEKLHLSTDSIKKYLYYTYQKLNVKNRTSAVSKALELGLIKATKKSNATV